MVKYQVEFVRKLFEQMVQKPLEFPTAFSVKEALNEALSARLIRLKGIQSLIISRRDVNLLGSC